MTGAVEDIGEALARTGNIVGLCTVLEGVNRNPFSVDLCDPQRRIPCWSIRIAVCPVDANQGRTDVRNARIAGLETGTRIYDIYAARQSGRGKCDPD